MDNLWAPWRLEYIKDQRLKGEGGPCVFCELKAQTPSEKNLVLYHGQDVYVVMNRFPYANGHLLVVPYNHLAKLQELSSNCYQEILTLTARSMDILQATINAAGFNCGMNVGRIAGCGILDHFHWHIVPRWEGDTNFLPVLSDTRPMPEYLSQTYRKIIVGFQKKGGGE